MSFVHLHVHTEYSLLDGAARIEPLIARAAELGQTALAITDHGVMYGIIDFYKVAKEHGIQPIIGCEVYMSPRAMDIKEGIDREYAHLVLLAQNTTGYANLIKLVSMGFTRGYYYRPRIDYDVLSQYTDGLVCLSACLSGDIPRALLDGRDADAKELTLRLKRMFPDRFFIELQDHALAEEKRINPKLIALAQECDIPLVVTNDSHYIRREDAAAQDILLCVNTGKTINEPGRMRFGSEEFYLKSEEEMRALFPTLSDAYANTARIAEMCDLKFDFGNTVLPSFIPPDGQTPTQYMRMLCEQGIPWRYGEETPEIRERLEFELEMIARMGYVEYYLIVWDFIRFARENDIMVGPGRGSGAGSIAAYLMGITSVDPIKFQLLFERFLNPERISMPDFDIDFCYERRGEVIDYVVRKYGADHVAQIVTFGTMAAKAALRDVSRVMELPYAEADRLAKLIPDGIGITLDKSLEMSAAFREEYDSNSQSHTVIDMARKLEGLPRHTSTHAAGVVISHAPLDTLVPLAVNDGGVTTQFTMKILELLGLLKMDFLGLRTLTVIRDTLDMLSESGGERIDMNKLTFDDPLVYAMMSEADTDGVFQLESTGMKAFFRELKPSSLEDVIAGISLYRPGPMDSIPKYVQGKNNKDSIRYLHPKLQSILDVTYGCIVYQEQVMQIVREVGGYSMGRADLVRRAMSKKKKDVMEKERQIFIYGLEENGQIVVPGAVRNGVSAEIASQIFDDMSSFAQYAFNKSHAAAYAVVAYQTAYLKRYHTPQFMAAMMNSLLGNADKTARYVHYCRSNRIPILPPDINRSKGKFTVEKGCIRFGLAAVKNVGYDAIQTVVAEREKGEFKTFSDFCERIGAGELNKRLVESLIRAGAFDSMGYTRSALAAGYERILDAINDRAKRLASGQLQLFELLDETPAEHIPNVAEYTKKELLSMEKEMLGVYASGHPLDEYEAALKNMTFNTSMLGDEEGGQAELKDGERVRMGGILAAKKDKVTKNGGLMAFVTIEDLFGAVEVLVFPAVLTRYANSIIQDTAVVVQGKLSVREGEDTKILADSIEPLKLKNPTTPSVPAPASRAPLPKLWLRISPEHRTKATWDEIAALCAHYSGEAEVRFCLGEKTSRMDYRVSPSQALIDELGLMLGKENVILK